MTQIPTTPLTSKLAADIEAAMNPNHPDNAAAKARLATLHKTAGGGMLIIAAKKESGDDK